MTTVLFTQKNSIYLSLGCDCYDVERNALTWTGSEPAIYHPPCRLFSRLRKFSTAPSSEKFLAYWSIEKIRRFGGVLEHPAQSTLWMEKNLPVPGKSDEFGFSIDIDQYWFGHKAQKRTWLYIVGILPKQLPDYPLVCGNAEFVLETSARKNKKPTLKKSERSATPEAFANWLIQIINLIKQNHA